MSLSVCKSFEIESEHILTSKVESASGAIQ